MAKSWIGKLLGAGKGRATPESLTPEELEQELANAQTAIARGEFDEASAILDPVLRAHPHDGLALTLAGSISYARGDYRQAAEILETAAEAPNPDANTFKFLAAALFQDGDDAKAYHYAKKSLEFNPADAQVINMLGVLAMNGERYEDAANHFHDALDRWPQDTTPLINLAVLDARARVHRETNDLRPRTENLRKQTQHRLLSGWKKGNLTVPDQRVLLALTANSPRHFATALAVADLLSEGEEIDGYLASLIADVYTRTGDVTKTIAMRELALKRSPNQVGLKGPLGEALIAAGGARWASAWEMTAEAARQVNRSSYATEVPEWDGSTLKGRPLFVYQDQGFGDILLALRFLTLLRERQIDVVLWVRPAIAELIRPLELYKTLLHSEGRPDPMKHGCVAEASLFSLVRILKLKPAQIKASLTLSVVPDRMPEWKKRIRAAPGIHVGLVTMGNPWRYDDWLRSLEPEALRPLARLQNVTWINLAVDSRPGLTQTIALLKMLDPAPDLKDFVDTAAIIASLDAVVAIDCSVAHLACALGKPVWLLLPTAFDWRWQIGKDLNPWWPQVRVLRCKSPAVWDEPVATLASELQVFIAEKGAVIAR